MSTLLRLIALSALVILIAPGLFGQLDDTTPPQLVSFVFGPASIDTSSAPAVVSVRFTAVDDFSGVTLFRVFFRSPSGQPSATGEVSFGAAPIATSTVFIQFPRFIETGTWLVAEVQLQDGAGNSARLTTDDLEGLGFPTQLSVKAFQDQIAPKLSAFNFTPKTIDTRKQPGTVQASFTLSDEFSGAASFHIDFLSPSGKATRSGEVQLSPSSSVKGSLAIKFPEFSPPGVWTVSDIRISDAAGNIQTLGTSDLTAQGFPTSLTVQSVADSTPPTLASFDFTPAAIDTLAGPAITTVNFHLTDDLSGVTSFSVVFQAPVPLNLTSVTASGQAEFDPDRDVTGSLPITFQQFSLPGIWTVSEIQIEDFAGNLRVLSTDDIVALGFPTQLRVDLAPNRPPVAIAGADQTVECSSPAGATLNLNGSASFDPDGDPLTFTWTGPFGTLNGPMVTATFPLGASTVTLTVDDGRGGTSSASLTITVVDTTPPVMTLFLDPSVLTPPDHRLVQVTANIEAIDVCQPGVSVVLLSITSNEPDAGTSDDDLPGDIQDADFGNDDRSFLLRAELWPMGNGRIYTVIYQASDASGNTSMATAQVTVPAVSAMN